MSLRRSGLAITFAVLAPALLAEERWDVREREHLDKVLYPGITDFPDFAQIRTAFDGALQNNPDALSSLRTLAGHQDKYVAEFAASTLGRFPSPETATFLKVFYRDESRLTVRGGALMGLARMRDGEAKALGLAALDHGDAFMRAAGVAALLELGDPSSSGAILAFYDAHSDEWDLLEDIGSLGDEPGSALVKDRLLAEAKNKANPFDKRLRAARGLGSMGLAALVREVLDRSRARGSYGNLLALKSRMVALARMRAFTVASQGDVDDLLRDVTVEVRSDQWQRPFRAAYVSRGLFEAVSDGPDSLPNTLDDISTAEALYKYEQRTFPD